ncbi:hypothetical protein Bbelb_095570 [Branchiostoma belcheri]|nr:hypothetical protein Bbelb_095570 [Branchiostoma belcheri]
MAQKKRQQLKFCDQQQIHKPNLGSQWVGQQQQQLQMHNHGLATADAQPKYGQGSSSRCTCTWQQQQMSQQMHNPNMGSQWAGQPQQQQLHPQGPMMQQLPPHPPQPQQPMGGLQTNLLEDPNLHDLLN